MSHDEYDRYLDDFGGRLEQAAASPRAPRRRWVLGLGGSLAAAGATAAIILLTGGTAVRVRPLDAVAQARAALTPPPGRIVHMVVVTGTHIDGSRAVDDDAPIQTWTAVSPPRWRVLQTSPPGGTTDEVSYAHGSQRTYVAARDELRVQRGYSDDGAAARAPSFLGLRGAADPADVLRRMLDSGRLRDAGERTVAGRRVRRLVGSTGGTGGQPVRSLVYDVDPATFAPVDGTLTDHVRLPRPGRGNTRRQNITTVFRVKRYETVPDTPGNAHLLRIKTSPKTKVIVRRAAALRRDRERAAEQRKRCHPSKGGNGIACPLAPRRSSAP